MTCTSEKRLTKAHSGPKRMARLWHGYQAVPEHAIHEFSYPRSNIWQKIEILVVLILATFACAEQFLR